MTPEELAQQLNLTHVRIRDDEIHASCPFSYKHTNGIDTHPSFSINIDKGVFHCFTCDSRGSLEYLISEVKKVPLSKALDILQEWGFDSLSRELKEKPRNDIPEFIPNGILSYFDKVDDPVAEVYRGEVDNQECLIYPVRRMDGKLVGALARSVEGRWHKAMWNIQKKLYLYGENLVQLEEPIIIVEGAGDAIALRKSGLQNVVALMGVSISNEQVEKLLDLSSEFVVWLDRDKAGAKGMNSILKKMEHRAKMRYVDPFKTLPKDVNDPKDVFEKYGPQKIKDVVTSAKTYIEYVMEDNSESLC